MTQLIQDQAKPDDVFPSVPDGPSFGAYLSNSEELQPNPIRTSSAEERLALKTLWHGLNRIATRFDSLQGNARRAHFVVKLVDNVKRHDCQLDEEMSDTLRKVLGTSVRESAVLVSQELLQEAIERMEQAKLKLAGKLHKEQKVKLEDRLERYLEEGARILEVIEQMTDEFDITYKPFYVRRQVFTELLLAIERMLDEVSPMRKVLDGSAISNESYRRICDNETSFRSWRKQIKKWRDNPTQRFKDRVKICAHDLMRICNDFAQMKEECYQDCLTLGMTFYDRCNRIRS